MLYDLAAVADGRHSSDAGSHCTGGCMYKRTREPAPVHPHLFRHARVRQIVRQTRGLPRAQRQAGWSRLQSVYPSIGDDEARELMRSVTD